MRPGGEKKKGKGEKGSEKKKGSSEKLFLVLAVLILCSAFATPFFFFQEEEINLEEVILSDEVEFDGIVLTKEELAQFDGSDPEKPIYLAILGDFFDVSGGRFYQKGGKYEFFSGSDASKAFATGDFRKDITDNLDGLKTGQIKGIQGWHTFFMGKDKYAHVGRVYGLFFDQNGNSTGYLRQKLEDGKLVKIEVNEEEEVLRPDCNSLTQKESARYWCTQKSGGIEREWVGYPRKVFSPKTKGTKCVCVENSDETGLETYEECDINSFECIVKK